MTCDFWDAIAKILPPVLIIAGWYVVVSNQSRQSRRKIIRDELEKLRAIVGAVGDASIKFHTHCYDDELRRDILSQLTLISQRVTLLRRIARTGWLAWDAIPAKRILDPGPCVIALRQAITLHHFDDPAQLALGRDSREINAIEGARRDVLAFLDETMIAALD